MTMATVTTMKTSSSSSVLESPVSYFRHEEDSPHVVSGHRGWFRSECLGNIASTGALPRPVPFPDCDCPRLRLEGGEVRNHDPPLLTVGDRHWQWDTKEEESHHHPPTARGPPREVGVAISGPTLMT